MMILSDDDLCEVPQHEPEEMEENASDADERSMPDAAEQAKAILGQEEEAWPHRQGDTMARISCEYVTKLPHVLRMPTFYPAHCSTSCNVSDAAKGLPR